MRHRYFLLFSILFFLSPLDTLSKGGNPTKGSLSGIVVDEAANEALAGAVLQLEGTTEGVVSNAKGIFSIQNLEPGSYHLLVNYLGFEKDTIDFVVQQGEETKLEIFLKEEKLEIATVEITTTEQNELQLINKLDLQVRPVNNSQELLRIVPGLFIAQHAGGGKAEQIFLRGFDIDHGTDLALSVDGMPVNMVSHAHGQGYADLHFLIPETVEKLQIDKGPHAANRGNLATAGAIDFQTKNSIEKNLIQIEAGSFNSYRALGMLKIQAPNPKSNSADAYIAGEYQFSEGYFESPQNLHRLNLFAKYRKLISKSTLIKASISDFRSQWNASGQIPDRAINQGLISRWGSIDDTEGGQTSRSNLNVHLLSNLENGWKLRQQIYASRYSFNLFSNFSFYANDSINGDQIRQFENRLLYGYQGSIGRSFLLGGKALSFESGLGIRMDDVASNGLYHTKSREYLGTFQAGQLRERNAFGFLNSSYQINEHLKLAAAVRLDALQFAYDDRLESNTGFARNQKAFLSPKLSLNYLLNSKLQFFAKVGRGFHSNDSRLVLAGNVREILPSAIGADLGIVMKPFSQMLVQATLWGLSMQQEFVYVGDEGIVEPSGQSRRLGFELSARWQASKKIFADCDLNVSHARSLEANGEATFIPLAPWLTSSAGLNVEIKKNLIGSLRYRLLADRAANEDWTINAKGYLIMDGSLNYTLKSNWNIGISAQNVLNSKWKEAQFATRSRLLDETSAIEEIHFTPGTPRAFKLILAYNF